MFENDVYAQIPYTAHYSLGFLALAALAGALASRKGSRVHILSGRLFVVGMMIAAVTAYYFVVVNFDVPPLFDATLMVAAVGSAILSLFTFREAFGLSNEVVYFGSMSLAPLILFVFWKKASRLDQQAIQPGAA